MKILITAVMFLLAGQSFAECQNLKGVKTYDLKIQKVQAKASLGMCYGTGGLYVTSGTAVSAVLETLPLASVAVCNRVAYGTEEERRVCLMGTVLGSIVEDGIIGPLGALSSLIYERKLPDGFEHFKSSKKAYKGTEENALALKKEFITNMCGDAKAKISCIEKEIASRSIKKIELKAAANNSLDRNSQKESISAPKSSPRQNNKVNKA